MEMGEWGNYLISINVIGFILFVVNTLLYTFTEKGQIDVLLTITSLLGGAFGIVLSMLIIDRKAVKGNMMSRVFVICVLVIQIVMFLYLTGNHKQDFTFEFINFFAEYKLITNYLIVVNIATFIAFVIDKYNAVTNRTRIRIVTLLILSFIGGSIGGMLAMYLFRHKIRKDYFAVGLPMILVTQIVLILYVMNI
jgi:uncharacterized membrane protein YsdA (DUF1294 family)